MDEERQWQEACRNLRRCQDKLSDPYIGEEERACWWTRAVFWTKRKDEIAMSGYREERWGGNGGKVF